MINFIHSAGDLVTGSQRMPFDFQHITSERDHNEKMEQLTEVPNLTCDAGPARDLAGEAFAQTTLCVV